VYVSYPERAAQPIARSSPSGLWLPSSSSLRVPTPVAAVAWRRAPQGGWMRASTPMRRSPGGLWFAGPGRSIVPEGLGQTSSSQTISSIASTGASVTISTLVALGTITGPIGAAIAGVVAAGMAIASLFKGCGQTCVEASNIANQVEQVLQQNLSQYMSAPVHYASLQAAALNNFNTAWAALTQACGNPQLASAGQNCISERQQGACSYKTTPGGWQGSTYVYPGANGSGPACWNWFIGYHDPIADDPTVVPDPAPATAGGAITSTVSQGLTDIGVSPSTTIFGIPLSSLLLPAAIAVALLLLVED
jgi:hypothetical protein